MAKRIVSRRGSQRPSTHHKGRKAKLVEIDGHLLTPEQKFEYDAAINARIGRGLPHTTVLEYGLDDFLAPFRPSTKITNRLDDVRRGLLTLSNSIGALSHYPFYGSQGISRIAGCGLLYSLADDLERAAKQIRHSAGAVQDEYRTHLQDWLESDRVYELLTGVRS